MAAVLSQMFPWNNVQLEAKVKGKKTELLDKKVEKDK